MRGDGRRRREAAAAPADGVSQVHAVLVHLGVFAKREHLKAARVGEDAALPAHERAEPAESRHKVGSGLLREMECVGEEQVGSGRREIFRTLSSHGCGGADGHELGRLDDRVAEVEATEPRRGLLLGRLCGERRSTHGLHS